MSNPIHLKCGEIRISFDDVPPEGHAGAVCVRFPGGLVEVAPNPDGSFWAQLHVNSPGSLEDARLYCDDGQVLGSDTPVPVRHVALRVAPLPLEARKT